MKTKSSIQAGYANQVITKPPAWHTLVVFDIGINNLTTGLFLVAALGELAAPTLFTRVAGWAYPIALVLLIIDLVLLVLDLGDKLRFHHMLRVFKPSSPMSLGTWCLTIYALFLTVILAVEVVVALEWLPADGLAWWLRKLAIIGGFPFAFGSAAYKGVLFSTTAQPGWKDARWLGAYFINSALLLGAAQLLLIAALLDDSRATGLLAPGVGVLAVLNLVPLGLLAGNLHPLLSRLFSVKNRVVATLALFFIGVVIPVGLLIAGSGVLIASTVLAAIMLTNFGMRFLLVKIPHLVTGGH